MALEGEEGSIKNLRLARLSPGWCQSTTPRRVGGLRHSRWHWQTVPERT